MDGKDRADANRDLRLSTNEYEMALKFFPEDDELYSSAFYKLAPLTLARTLIDFHSAFT